MTDTLRGRLLELCARHPDRLYLRCVFPDGSHGDLTYRSLVERGSQFAQTLRRLGVAAGDVAIIILPHSVDLHAAFFGAILGGHVPSILSGPSFKLNPEHYQRELQALLDRIEGRAVITDQQTADFLHLRDRRLGDAHLVLADQIDAAPAAPPSEEVSPEAVVLLQHSSGSTGLKKGVALSNRAVLQHIDDYAAELEIAETDRIASWLPLYHDMGLIACTVMPAMVGIPVVALSPFHWVTSPATLFRVIDRERCTLAWLPNFAYDFLATRVRASQVQGLSLRSMRGWINCSEPTINESHRRFFDRFESMGVRRETLLTCYAAAETTFAVSQSTEARPPRIERVARDAFQTKGEALPVSDPDIPALEMLSGGTALPDTEIRILDDAGRALPDRRVGEITIRSGSLFSGYFKDPAATAAVLRDGWYASGDLGYLAEGHVFITGRKKDLLILGGRNFYPQDIERIVSGVPGIYPGRVVALGLDDPAIGTQRLIVLAETEEAAPADAVPLAAAVRATLSEHLDCVIDDLRLLPHMWLLKTSSGKIARAPNLQRYLRELGPRPQP